MQKVNEEEVLKTENQAENDQRKHNVWPFAAGFAIGLLTPFVFLDAPRSIGLFSLLVVCLTGGMVMGCVMSLISNLANRT